MGDFNIAPDDRDVHDPAEWHEKILCSTAERAALQRLLDLGMTDSFRLFDQDEALFSWWDYRAAGFRRNRGLRIDLLLVSDARRKELYSKPYRQGTAQAGTPVGPCTGVDRILG